jgi:hypothetical protein
LFGSSSEGSDVIEAKQVKLIGDEWELLGQVVCLAGRRTNRQSGQQVAAEERNVAGLIRAIGEVEDLWIALYITALAKRGLAVSTIRWHGAAIARAHRQAGYPSPTSDPRVLTILEGIARVHGSAPNKKTALLRDPLLDLIDRTDTTPPPGYATSRCYSSASKSGSEDRSS